MPVGDQFLIRVVGTLHGQFTINSFNFEQTTGAAAADAGDIRTAFVGAVQPEWSQFANVEWNWVETHVQRIRPLPVLLDNIFAETGQGGTITGQSCPPQDAGVITLYGANARRADRGRRYIPGVPESFHENGTYTSAGLTALGNLAVTFISTLSLLAGSIILSPRVHSQQLNKLPRDVFVPVVKTLARGTVRTQRRRQLGRGI